MNLNKLTRLAAYVFVIQLFAANYLNAQINFKSFSLKKLSGFTKQSSVLEDTISGISDSALETINFTSTNQLAYRSNDSELLTSRIEPYNEYNSYLLDQIDELRRDIEALKSAKSKEIDESLFNLHNTIEHSTKLSAYVFGDYFSYVRNEQNDVENEHGFWIRRIYFTVDNQMTESVSARIRFEMEQDGSFPNNGSKMSPVIKDMYLNVKTGSAKIYLGISPTPAFAQVEEVWGYRFIEKTPLDLQKLASSRDLGISIKGRMDSKGLFRYHAMVGNGSSNKSETNTGKSVMSSFSVHPDNKFLFELFGAYTRETGLYDSYTFQTFTAYKAEGYRMGLLFSHVEQTEVEGDVSVYNLVSGFTAFGLAEKWNAFVRADIMFQPNPSGSKIPYLPVRSDKAAKLFILGVDYNPISNLIFSPNIELVAYDFESLSNVTAVPRITFYLNF